MKKGICITCCIACLFAAAGVGAMVTVTNTFSNNMVLQRSMPVPILGKAASGEQVTVTMNGQSKTVTTPSSGAWRAVLDAMPEGGPYTLTIKGANTLTVTGVYVGEVWQVAGQSNMDTRLSFYANLADSIKTANVPLLRYNTLRQPGQTSAGSNPWLVVSPSTAGDLSAIGYFFGREIQKSTGVAVGLIVTAVGGTTLASWQDPATLAGFAIAGATGNWVWATATVKGDTVIATSATVAAPTRVRYAWADNPMFNLFNSEGLPASPFTTESPAIPVTVRQGESSVARRGQTAGRITVGSMKPTKTIFIDSDEEIQTIGVFDVSGRTWETFKPGARRVVADLRGLNAGVYFISIRTSGGRHVQKVSVWK